MKIKRIALSIALALMILVLFAVPAMAAPGFPNIAGTWYMSGKIYVKYLDGTSVPTVTTATLVIADNTTTTKGTITNATLAVSNYGTLAVAGFVGQGYKPRLSLGGVNANVIMTIKGTYNITTAKIAGDLQGWSTHSQGSLGDDPVAAAATWSTVENHSGSVSALLTQAAAAGSTYVEFTPPAGIHVHDLDTITAAKYGLWFNLQDGKSGGPQLELRFTAPTNVNPDGVGHVDVTLLTPTTGTGLWVNRTYGQTFDAMYYGNDPWDGTAFDGGAPAALSTIEAAINAETAMTDNSSNASNWTLSRVRIEIWDAGARTCYVDDVMINGTLYNFEPMQFYGSFSAHK